MPIYYDFYKNPPREDDGGEPLLHPRPVVKHTVKTDELAEMISAMSSFSSGDLTGILQSLADRISVELRNGRNVYLEGIGTFSLTLKSRFVKDKSEIRGPSVKVKAIKFRADKYLKDSLITAPVEKIKRLKKPVEYTDDQRLSRIRNYLNQENGIHLTQVMQLNHCSYTKAKKDLNKLMDAGEIKQSIFGRMKIYSRLS